MTDARAFLLEALQRVVDGGDIDNAELAVAVPDFFALDDLEKRAWEELSHWADDDDIREKDERYAEHQRNNMRRLVTKLSERAE